MFEKKSQGLNQKFLLELLRKYFHDVFRNSSRESYRNLQHIHIQQYFYSSRNLKYNLFGTPLMNFCSNESEILIFLFIYFFINLIISTKFYWKGSKVFEKILIKFIRKNFLVFFGIGFFFQKTTSHFHFFIGIPLENTYEISLKMFPIYQSTKVTLKNAPRIPSETSSRALQKLSLKFHLGFFQKSYKDSYFFCGTTLAIFSEIFSEISCIYKFLYRCL